MNIDIFKKMSLSNILILSLIAFVLVGTLYACVEQTKTVEGTILQVSDDSVTVETTSGEQATFEIDDETEINISEELMTGQPPQMPGSPNEQMGEVPAKPDGEDDEARPTRPENEQREQPPAKPDGGTENEPPTKPDEPSEQEEPPYDLFYNENGLRIGARVKMEVRGDRALKIDVTSYADLSFGGNGGAPDEYDAAYTFDEDSIIENKSLVSDGGDDNVVLVEDDITVNLINDKITRTSTDSTGGDRASFYGFGAALLATAGNLIIDDCTITTDANGGAGVFAYDKGVVNISNSSIGTKKDASGGIHVAGGGELTAENVDVTTSGASSAAIRSDRGGGKMNVYGGTFTTNGNGSPAIYCTADIEVNNAKLTANNSEAICIEGFNSLSLIDCELSGNQPEDERNEVDWNIILYQSMSGDAEEGNATFSMKGGSLTAKHGGMFYTTNTKSTFIIEDVDITYADDAPFLLRVSGNENKRGWGTSGKNGADCSFTTIEQVLRGDVIYDSISTLNMTLTNASAFAGAFIREENNGGDWGYANLTIDETSTWIVTGDSTLNHLYIHGKVLDADRNSVTIMDENGNILVKGNSSYTITVKELFDY